MTEKFNPFRRAPESQDKEIVPELQTYLDEFRHQVKNMVDFSYPDIPQELKDAVYNTIVLTDIELMAKEIGDNDHDLYANRSVREQFNTWMKLKILNRELGDVKELAFKNEQLGAGEKMMLSNLLVEMDALLRGRGVEKND